MAETTGLEKAAILLGSLRPEAGEQVLARLPPDKALLLRQQIERLRQAPREGAAVADVLQEFRERLRGTPAVPGSGVRIAHGTNGVEKAAVNGKPAAPAAALPPAGAPANPGDADQVADPLSALRRLDADRLARALDGEHAPAVALVLNYLDADAAAEVLKRLPNDVRRDVSVRLGQGPAAGLDIARRVARVVLRRSQAVAERPPEPGGPANVRKVADMLRLLERGERTEILAALDAQDPATAAKVKELLYVFDDLLRLDDRSVQKVLAEIDSKTLTVALKGAPDPIAQKVQNNLSKRARETLLEEMQFLEALPGAQVREAQKAVADVIQRLDQAGSLVMLE